MSGESRNKAQLRVLFIEPFCGGSHRLFAEGYARLSRHSVRLLTLPASHWKWRMRGAHLSLAKKIGPLLDSTDCLLASDMLGLAELAGTEPRLLSIPKVVYFHENQLGYPVPKGESPDVHFGFTNISTALAADRLVFNSRFHMEEFLGGIGPFLGAMPDHRPRGMAEGLRAKSSVVYPGIDCQKIDRAAAGRRSGGPVTVLWNHRWEFDKRPEVFFGVLNGLAGEGMDFRLHVLGENFQARPKVFEEAGRSLGGRIGRFGYIEDRGEYIRTLHDSDVVVSTAVQEFFGISVMEAAYCGCLPLVPDRLVYPELYGGEYLYRDEEELRAGLAEIFRSGTPDGDRMEKLKNVIRERFDIRLSAARLDGIIEGASAGRRNQPRQKRPPSPPA